MAGLNWKLNGAHDFQMPVYRWSLSKGQVFLAFLFFCIFPADAKAISAPTPRANQDQIKVIESNLSREKQKFEKFNSREKDLLQEVSDLEQDVAEKIRGVDELGEKIRLAKIEVKKLEKKAALLEQSLKNIEIQLEKRLVALYKYARKGYIKILADVSEPDQFWQRVKYLKAITEEDRKVLLKLAGEELEYKRRISRTKEQLEKKKVIKNKEEMRLASLRKGLEKQVIRLMKTHKEKEFYETAVKELRLAAQDLKQALLKIEKKEVYNTSQSSRFANAKHQLPFPIEGKVIRAKKLSGSAMPNLNKGIFIEGTSDTRVKAVFPGRVDFSGLLKGYGEIVIISHGSRFFTISAQLSQRKKKEGDMVELGEVIGLVGRNKSSKKARLYFEIRKAGKSLDPLRWLKAR